MEDEFPPGELEAELDTLGLLMSVVYQNKKRGLPGPRFLENVIRDRMEYLRVTVRTNEVLKSRLYRLAHLRKDRLQKFWARATKRTTTGPNKVCPSSNQPSAASTAPSVLIKQEVNVMSEELE